MLYSKPGIGSSEGTLLSSLHRLASELIGEYVGVMFCEGEAATATTSVIAALTLSSNNTSSTTTSTPLSLTFLPYSF
jgi:hypothetical protein